MKILLAAICFILLIILLGCGLFAVCAISHGFKEDWDE